MIYDINGLPIENENPSASESKAYDFWTNAKNFDGTKGYVRGVKLEYDGSKKTSNSYICSGYLPINSGIYYKISDASGINIANSYAFVYGKNKSMISRKALSTFLDGNILKPYGGYYVILSLYTSNANIEITQITPSEPMLVDNKYVHSYWNDVSYDKTDYTYTDMDKYSNIGGANGTKPKCANVEIPYTSDFDSYRIELCENPSFGTDKEVYEFSDYTQYASVKNLKADTTYFCKVYGVLNNVDTLVVDSQISTYGFVRMIDLSNINNARDIGNKKTSLWGKVKQGKIYRCAKMDGIDAEGIATLDELGIKAEIDLRTSGEKDSNYVPYLEYYNLTVSAENISKGIADGFANVFKKSVQLLSENKPLIFHCQAGVDRTGAVASIFLGVLGVSASDIAKDYELSAFYNGATRNDLEDDGHCCSENALAIQRRSGDTLAEKYANFLISGGATEQEIEDFRCLMLTDY